MSKVELIFMSPKEYAQYRGVHRNTVIKWIKSKRIYAEQTGGIHGRFSIPLDVMGEGRYWPAAVYKAKENR